jgi:hydrogenase maturation protease
MRLMVVGCGNRMAGDDRAGLEILHRLEAQAVGDCILRALPQSGVELLELFREADVMLFIDAVESGAPAGALHLLSLPSAEAKPRALPSITGHGWGLLETLDLARALGRPIPKILLLGIELQSAIPGTPPSAAVNRAMDRVVGSFPILVTWLRSLSAQDITFSKLFSPEDDSFPQSLEGCGFERPGSATEGTAHEKSGGKQADLANAAS